VKIDRITQALERAQAQSATLGGANGEGILRPAPAPLPPAAPRRELRRTVAARAPIVYTKTRVTGVRQEDLKRRRVAVDGIAAAELVDSVKLLRRKIVQRMREKGWRTLAVVSPHNGEGRTFMAVNFAVSLTAEVDQTVLLVDADLRRPAIHRLFGLPAEPGLSNYLIDQTPLDSILVNPGIERLVIMPAGAPQSNSAELLRSKRMATLVAEMKSRYSDRIVVIDLPPLLGSADALAFAPLADAVVMVVEDKHSNREDIRCAQQLLSGANLIGVILNKAWDRSTGRIDRRSGFFERLFKRD
jgi:capsular exopolysaccharide synthesis family protein